MTLFNTGSDHRLVQGKIVFDEKVERKLKVTKAPKRRSVVEFSLLREVEKADFKSTMKAAKEYDLFVEEINRCVRKAEVVTGIHSHQNRIFEDTRLLVRGRAKLKKNCSNNLEYRLLCHIIRRKLKEDCEAYRKQKLLTAAEQIKIIKEYKKDFSQYHEQLTMLLNEREKG